VLGPNPPIEFAALGQKRLYRVAKRGDPSPLYIGMVVGLKSSVVARLASHVGHLVNPRTAQPSRNNPVAGRSEVGNLRVEIRKELSADQSLGAITVQIGIVNSGSRTLDNKLLHAYEAALQVLEHPKTYVGTVWTFEEEGS
jgi:hypothetical protein